VNLESDSPARDAGRFHTTHWTVVLRAAQSQVPGGQAALAQLCRLYWYPLYGFVRYRGYSPDDAQDLTQGFFLHLLGRRVLSRVDPLKGKFRTFLLVSLQNFLATEVDRARCLKRGGNMEFIPWDTQSAEERYRLEPADYLTGEKIFDARWAMTVLGEAMRRLDEDYTLQGKAAIFEALKAFLDPLNSKSPPSYEQAAGVLRVSVTAVKTLIHRLRKQFTSFLREEVASTVSDPREVDDEIRALCEALVASEGRLNP
jgi:RNA polymerase sigma-70 factor (ECF subfamily)